MNRKTFYLALALLASLVLGMVIFSYLKNQELNSPINQNSNSLPAKY